MPFATNRGTQIAYEVVGSGPPVLLLHSFLCSREMWRPQIEALARQHTLIAADHRGHGRSGLVTEPFTLYDMIDDANAVLDDVGVEQAVWAGLSIGGMMAIRAALSCPERVSGLVLVNTSADAERRWLHVKYGALGVIARTIGLRPLVGTVMKLMFSAEALERDPAMADTWRHHFTHGLDVPSALAMLGALLGRETVAPQLGQIGVPTLVVSGSGDKSIPPTLCLDVHAGIPDAELVELEGVGHLATLEAPARINAATAGFLERHQI